MATHGRIAGDEGRRGKRGGKPRQAGGRRGYDCKLQQALDNQQNQTITVTVKNQYGNDVIHPACATSRLFARIAGTVTLTTETRSLIKELGYRIEIAAPTYKI